MDAERVVRSSDVLGECPVWSAARQQLFWLDLARSLLHSLDPATGECRTRLLDARAPLGGLVATSDPGRLALAHPGGVALLDIETLEMIPIAGAPPGDGTTNYNDAGVDRSGRLWLSTAEASETRALASLLRLADGAVETVDSGFVVANGPVFSAEGDQLFVSDSLGGRILAYDLDGDGGIAGRRAIVTFDESMGYPDGLAVDAEGGLWVSHWAGSRVTRWTFGGELTDQIGVPARNVTSVAFGGPGLDRLFITTAADDATPGATAGATAGGDLYSAAPGVAGQAETLLAVPAVPA